jgi:hypothetical protein
MIGDPSYDNSNQSSKHCAPRKMALAPEEPNAAMEDRPLRLTANEGRH